MGVTQVALRKVDGPEILRRVERHGVTLLCAAPAVVNAVLDAVPDWEGELPGPGHHPDRGGRCAAAVADHRADRVRAGLGVPPDLRADRDVPGADRQPGPGRVGRPPLRPAGPQAHAGRRAGRRHRAHGRRARRGAGPVQHGHGRLLAPARGDGRRAGRRLVPHRRRRADRRGGPPEHPRPQEGRHHHRWRERLVDRGGGRHLLAGRRGRGGGHRRPPRQVGRDGPGPGGGRRRAAASPRRSSSPTAGARWPGTSARSRSRSATELPRTATGKLQKFRLRAPYWEGLDRQVN